MRFGAQEWLLRIWLILPLVAVTALLLRRRTRRLALLAPLRNAGTMLPGYRPRQLRLRLALRLVALFLILIALSRPQWGVTEKEVPHRGLDLMIVLDTSRSMLADDLKPNRLQQAKWAVRDFVRQLDGDRTGLVAFAGGSFLYCPLTVDRNAFLMSLDDLYAGMIPRGGTAIEQALRTAVDSFDPAPDTDRVILLITDGEDHEGDPLRMVDRMRQENILLFCVGAATPDGALIPVEGGFLRDAQGQVVRSRLNESLLRELAARTGGLYVRAAPGDFGLDHILETGLAGLRRGERETRKIEIHTERMHWFALAALFSLLIEGLLRPAILLGILLMLVPPSASAEEAARDMPESDVHIYNQGVALFKDNRPDEAAEVFAEAAAIARKDGLRQKALYNRGISLLVHATDEDPEKTDRMLEKASEAIGLFEQALLLDLSDDDARRNLERALRRVTHLRIREADRLILAADRLLTDFAARNARQKLEEAEGHLRLVLEEIAPGSVDAERRRRHIHDRLNLLDRAVRETRYEVEYAKQAIDLFEYRVAAGILRDDKPFRRFAFDLDEGLREEFESLLSNNQDILDIIEPEVGIP